MKVKVYSTPDCPWCHKAKDFFKENKIEFEEADVSESKEAAKEMIEKSKQQGVPVIEVDGKIIIGFKEEELKEVLKIK
jgi:glutaredoxin-like YruB-family protein